MKRITLILLSVFLLTSCTSKEVIDNEDKEETIIYTNNYDQLTYTPVSEYDETIDPNNSWTFDGDGSYEYGCIDGVSYKKLNINGQSSLSAYNIPLSNGTYTISFNIASDTNTSINLSISSNTTYLDENIDVLKGTNEYSYTFNRSSDYGASIVFNFNGTGNIEISELYLSSTNKRYDSRINQVGYLTNLEKEVIFTYNPGDCFGIYDASDDTLVYEGSISKSMYDKDADEDVYKAFFKDFNLEGEYYIKTEFGDYTYNFTVSNDIYDNLSKDVLHFLYVQRCGTDIVDEYNNLSHPACHTSESKLWTTLEDTYLDTTGGWHDAGDYGRYLYTTNETIADLLFSILYGESSEALLDEARYGLEFILKLQRDSGSVYNKVVSKEFSAFISPEYDNQETYVLYKWTSSTASFAGCMGLAYEAYKGVDEEFSNKCLEAFNKAIDYLYNNQSPNNEINPDGFNVGTYYVGDESDERLFAYSVAYKITKDEKYLRLINNILNEDSGEEYYGIFSLISLLDSVDMNNDLYEVAKNALVKECNGISDELVSNGYPYPSSSYYNSNGTCARSITRLLLGARYLKDERYLVRGAEAINYLLGENVLDLCFVYEYGYNSPKAIHNRLAYSHGQTTIRGALASGVVEFLSEDILKRNLSEDTPAAKRWVDHIDSYSNVEPSINNNSSLVLALSLLQYANNNKLQ